MEIEYEDGCVYSTLKIDGKETEDIEYKELKSILHKMIDNKACRKYTMNEILIHICEEYGEWECVGMCETCGYMISKYKLKVE